MTDRVRADLLAVYVTTYSNLNLQLSGALTPPLPYQSHSRFFFFHVDPTACVRLGPSNRLTPPQH